MEKATLGFRIYKIWRILKRFAGTFRRAQTLKLGGPTYPLKWNVGLKCCHRLNANSLTQKASGT